MKPKNALVRTFAPAFSAGFLLLSQSLMAQSIALDNATTGDPSSSAFSFVNNHYEPSEGTWIQSGLRFVTGSSISALDSVTIPLVSATASPNDLQIEIWDASGADGFWGNKLFTASSGTLLNDAGLGEWNNFQFSFAGGTELAPDSQYWILYRNTVTPELFSHQHALWLTDQSLIPLANDAYQAFDSELGWVADGAYSSTADTPVPDADNFKPGVWTITATAVPEPSGGLLAGLAGTLALGRRRRDGHRYPCLDKAMRSGERLT